MPKKGEKLTQEHKEKLMAARYKKKPKESTKSEQKEVKTKITKEGPKHEAYTMPRKERIFVGDWDQFLITLVKRSKMSTKMPEYERVVKQSNILCESLKYFFNNSDKATNDELLVFTEIIGEILESIGKLLSDEVTHLV